MVVAVHCYFTGTLATLFARLVVYTWSRALGYSSGAGVVHPSSSFRAQGVETNLDIFEQTYCSTVDNIAIISSDTFILFLFLFLPFLRRKRYSKWKHNRHIYHKSNGNLIPNMHLNISSMFIQHKRH